MTGKMSLVELKKIQWAKEREEMARLNGHWEAPKPSNIVHPTIRSRLYSRDQTNRKPLRAGSHCSSTTSLKSLDFPASIGSMINIVDGSELPVSMRKRSPSLPPIYSKENQAYLSQELPALEVEGSRYTNHPQVQKHLHRESSSSERNLPACNLYEEREGETSGYASDSIEAPIPPTADVKRLLPLGKVLGDGSEMSERTWRNPYCDTPETSLSDTRRLSSTRLGELNRPRWGSVWGQENNSTDPPPPSWLERGLTRLDHSSQVLVINHDSASSPDSSTTGSTSSDSKTYLRGQNIPVDAHILHEREARRQKALELQTAIKQQLMEKDRQRKEERERRLREEREEEARIQRERDKEKQRFDEEQKRLKDKEDAQLKKEVAMKEILETAERLAKETKRQRRRVDDDNDNSGNIIPVKEPEKFDNSNDNRYTNEVNVLPNLKTEEPQIKKTDNSISSEIINKIQIDENPLNSRANDGKIHNDIAVEPNENLIRLPINKEVAIVLTGRIENTNFLNSDNIQLVNFVVNTSPRESKQPLLLNADLNVLAKSFANSSTYKSASTIVENRLLTPSKYRTSGRDFGTQTDGESEINDLSSKDTCKERKDVVNNNRRDVEKSTCTSMEEKNMNRSKSQPRQTLETRPQWNANRPGTRYRTQSEKDPHYQRRLRLRRRRVESSDERSRSPSPDRRKTSINKSKNRNAIHRKSKIDNYDADMSMDSFNSVVPMRIDEHGRINVQMNKNINVNDDNQRNHRLWRDQDILSQLASLKNGLLSKQREWDSERCLVSPNIDFC